MWIYIWVAMLACRSFEAQTDSNAARVTPKVSQPDIIVLLVNGLRADSPDLKPVDAFLETFGRQPSRRFLSAYVQSSKPFPSFASFLTGRYVSAIPACGIPSSNNQTIPFCATVPTDRHTLPHILGLYGYKTLLGSTSSTSVLSNIPDQFDAFISSPPQGVMPGTLGPFRGMRRKIVDWWGKTSSSPRLLVATADIAATLSRQERSLVLPEDNLGKKRALLTHYVKKASMFGKELNALLAELPDSGRERIVIVSSLFGVSIMEETGASNAPRQSIHSDILYDRVVHVPLMIFGIDEQSWSQDISQPVELIDVFATLIGLGGGTLPSGVVGNDLKQEHRDGLAYGELGDMLYLRRNDRLLTVRAYSHGGTSLDPKLTNQLVQRQIESRLHNVLTDPLQNTDLSSLDEGTLQKMMTVIKDIRLQSASPPKSYLNSERLKALREQGAFGYW